MTNFHELYERYSRDVYRFAYWLSGSREEAEDITAETFSRVWVHRADLRAGSLKAYLFTIARNLFLQSIRKYRRWGQLDHEPDDPGPRPDEVAEARSELAEVMSAIRRLPELERTILIMRAHHQLPLAEIAHCTGLSVSAIKVKIHRARLKLQSINSNQEEGSS